MSRKAVDFESACTVLGIEPILPESNLPEPYRQESIDRHKMQVIADAINKENNDWKPDYTDSSQWKYRPFFRFGSGGWACGDYVCWCTCSCVGSRLVFENYDDAEYAGELFIKLGLTI